MVRGVHNHSVHSYRVWVAKMGRMITRNSIHVKATSIIAEQYLRDHNKTNNNHVTVNQYKPAYPMSIIETAK